MNVYSRSNWVNYAKSRNVANVLILRCKRRNIYFTNDYCSRIFVMYLKSELKLMFYIIKLTL